MNSSPENGIPSAPVNSRQHPTDTEIASRARQLWEGYGRPEGRDEQIWLEAERQLLGVDSEVVDLGGGPVAAKPLRQSTSTGPRRQNSKR
jgi:hypothetical protein